MDVMQTIQWWRDRAESYFTDMQFGFSRPDLIERLGLGPTSHILEIGFGYGRELAAFCRISEHVYGLELSPFTCNLARDQLRAQGIAVLPNLYIYDGQVFPFQDGVFDLVYSCFLTQHMSRVAVGEMLQEVMRILKPGGQCLMEFFGDPMYFHPTGDKYSGRPDDGGMYNNAYMPPGLRRLMHPFGEILWIEPWSVSVDGRAFQNWWVCARQ